eukprot:m.5925 g.5925  ORF g.5925 m.5925 type:complete len:275 (+) comp14474_c0_seq1:145-969(+)
MLEELKLRRSLADENEKRMKELVGNLLDVDRQKDDAVRQYAAQIDRQREEQMLLRQQYEDKVQSLEDKMVLLSLSVDSKQKEIDNLKMEVRRVQMEKYDLERVNVEITHKLKVQSSIKQPLVAKMTDIEGKLLAIVKTKVDVERQLAKLQKNVEVAVTMNKRLQFAYNHHECETEALKRELSVKCVEVAHSNHSNDEILEKGVSETDSPTETEMEVRLQRKLVCQLESQIRIMSEGQRKMEASLQEAHRLVERTMSQGGETTATPLHVPNQKND